MAYLCGSCGMAYGPNAARCPVCGRAVGTPQAVATLPNGPANGYLIARWRVGCLAGPASGLLLMTAVLIWLFGFSSPGFGQPALLPTQTPPAFDQPAATAVLTPDRYTPIATPSAIPSATATAVATGSGGTTPTPTPAHSGAPTPTATARPSPSPTFIPTPTPTNTPISQGG